MSTIIGRITKDVRVSGQMQGVGTSAYDFAVQGGYTGTPGDFVEDMAGLGEYGTRLTAVETELEKTKEEIENEFVTLANLVSGKFDNESGWYKSNVVTAVADNNVAITASANGYYATTAKTVANHVYLAKFTLLSPNTITFRALNGNTPYTNYLTSHVNASANPVDVYLFFTAKETSSGVSLRFISSVAQTFYLSYVTVVDITDLLGNEEPSFLPLKYLLDNFPRGYIDGTAQVHKSKIGDARQRVAIDEELASKKDIAATSIIDLEDVTLKKVQILSNFDDESWSVVSGAGSVAADGVNVKYGSKSIKMATPSSGTCAIVKSIDADGRGMSLIMNVYIPTLAAVKSFHVYFYSEGDSSYFYYNLPVFHSVAGWNRYVIPLTAFTKSTSADNESLSAIKSVRVIVTAAEGHTAEVSLDMIGLAKQPLKRGVVVLAFDDNQSGVWHYAKPAMDKYGFRGVVYTIKDLVDKTNFMTLDQLKILYDMGWDVSTHGQVTLTSLSTPEAIRAELLKNYDYLIDNGFVRSAKHYATPEGKFNDVSMLEIKKIFTTHRGTKFRQNAFPISDKFLLNNLGGNEANLAELKVYADTAEKYKTMAIINWHQISETPTGNEGSAEVFGQFMDYLATKNLDVVPLSDIFNPMD